MSSAISQTGRHLSKNEVKQAALCGSCAHELRLLPMRRSKHRGQRLYVGEMGTSDDGDYAGKVDRQEDGA